jgi:hypothetical protein
MMDKSQNQLISAKKWGKDVDYHQSCLTYVLVKL